MQRLLYFTERDSSQAWRVQTQAGYAAFKLWCWRRLLRVPWTARRSNQSILKEISPECSLEGLMLKLKLQYFGHLMRRTDSFEKTLMLGKIEGRRRRGRQRMKWLNGITDSMDMSLSKLVMKLKLQYFGHLMWRADSLEKTLMLGKIEGKRRGWQRIRWLGGITYSMDMNLSKLWEMVKDRGVCRVAVHGVGKSRAWLDDWTTTTTQAECDAELLWILGWWEWAAEYRQGGQLQSYAIKLACPRKVVSCFSTNMSPRNYKKKKKTQAF